MNASTPVPPRRPTAGIDWASTDHAVAVVDPDGVVLKRCTVKHTGAGLRALVKTMQRADVDAVGIERPDGPVGDALLEAGFTVFVIAPNQLEKLRSRYGSAGNKDDRFDAYVLADSVRTDRHRLTVLTQDSPQTITLRMTVRRRLTGSVRPACRRGCARPATTTPPTPRPCTPTSPLRLVTRSGRKPPPALQ